MALTPEQVVEKRFQATKFREGYDQDEVDDFLDEVVNELRRLNAENDDLRGKLTACERRVGELTRSSGTGSTALVGDESETETPGPSETERDVEPQTSPEPEPAAQPVPVSATVESEPSAAAAQATEMLALAQRLHDEHIHTGEQRRDQLISEAEAQAHRLVAEAEDKHRETLGSLEQERSKLVTKIDELRAFERDYRSRLKAYLETQLRDLEAEPLIVPGRDQRAGQGGDGYPVGTPG
jgi:DivIVA domain-containing protein